jgi:hypothetical protein
MIDQPGMLGDRRAAERGYQFPPSNGDWHVPSRARVAWQADHAGSIWS